MLEISAKMLDLVKRERVTRYALCTAHAVKKGIFPALVRAAKRENPACVVEKRHMRKRKVVNYHLRPVQPGEKPGQLIKISDRTLL